MNAYGKKESLHESELRLRALLQSAVDAIISADDKGNIISWNKSAERIFGYKEKEVIGKPLTIIIPEPLRNSHAKGIKRASSGKKPRIIGKIVEMQGVRKDGKQFPVELSLSAWKKGKKIFYTGIIRDITKHKLADEKLKLFAQAVQEAVDGVQIVDLNGRIIYSNKAVEKMYGFSSKEYKGKHVDAMNVDPKFASKIILPAIKESGHWSGELLVKHKNGNRFPILLSTSMVKNDKGIPLAMVGIIRDITATIQKEEELKRLNKQITKILESITDAFFALDNEWKFAYINNQAEKFFHRKRGELIGKNIFEQYPHLVGTEIEKKYHEAIQTQKVVYFEHFSQSSKRWHETRVYPSNDGLSVYFSDVTQRKKLENQKDEFIAVASHELKTPITTIKGYAQILEKHFSEIRDTKASYFLSNINTQIDRLVALINDLLDVTKIQAGKLNFYIKEFDLDNLIRKIIIDFQYIIDKHEIIKKGEIKKKVFADEYRIGQVLINLITNAIKYSKEGNKIIVGVKSNNNKVTVSVKDFGIGIAKRNQAKIFDRFFRLGERTSSSSGFGLGLYIAKEIVERHHGKIWVKSQKGKGSTFYFTLPLR